MSTTSSMMMLRTVPNVRSLSMPGNLSVLAEEIQALEERLWSRSRTAGGRDHSDDGDVGVPLSSSLSVALHRSQSMNVLREDESMMDDEDFFLIEEDGEEDVNEGDLDEDEEDERCYHSKTPNQLHFGSSSPPRTTSTTIRPPPVTESDAHRQGSFLPPPLEVEEEGGDDDERIDSENPAMSTATTLASADSRNLHPALPVAGLSASPLNLRTRGPAEPQSTPTESSGLACSVAEATASSSSIAEAERPVPRHSQEQLKAAQACVDALAAVFGCPGLTTVTPRTDDWSPTSVLAWPPSHRAEGSIDANHESTTSATSFTGKLSASDGTTVAAAVVHPRLPRSQSVDSSGGMCHVRSHGSLPRVREDCPSESTDADGSGNRNDNDDDCNLDPRFALLRATDRAQSLPPRLVPSRSAKPKKSAMKRTSSTTSTASSGATSTTSLEEGGCCNVPASAALPESSSSVSLPRSHSSTSSLKRNVSFTNLEIREYTIALSDHPGCSYGPPIQLGWDYQDRQSVEVDEYEKHRPPRRSPHQLVLSYNVRRYLLLKRAGYSKSELQHAMKEVERVKRGRMVTDLFLPASPIDETFEEVVNRVKQLLFPPSLTGKSRQAATASPLQRAHTAGAL